MTTTPNVAAPKPTLSVIDAIALIVGIVIGAGIFRTPPLVAGNTGSGAGFLGIWAVGGVVSLIGALCYAELATTYPHAGGTYYYLLRAFGKPVAFLFAWARLAVIQTGSIALLAFISGDYLAELLPLGPFASLIYAALTVVLLTLLNLLGVRQGKLTQVALTVIMVIGLVLVIVAGLFATASAPEPAAPTEAGQANFGLGMVLVLLTYGGWNEAAYISAELKHVQRNMVRALMWGISLITLIYLLINLAYLRGLGFAGLEKSQVVAADLMRQSFGDGGAVFISLLIAVSVLSTANATIFTGARTNYAMGQDFPLFRWLGRWQERGNTPRNALLVQGAIALILVLFGAFTRDGFETMVDFTAPVFWLFFLLSGVSLFVLRQKDPNIERPFRVPAYPLVPILFCLTCGYLLYSSLVYTKIGALVGVVVLALGVPLFFLARRSRS